MNYYGITYTIISYFIGCFCTAYYYGMIIKGIDLRKFGSGNLGATNSGRVLGRRSFIIVLAFDFFKGFLVVMIGKVFNFGENIIIIAMYSVVIGHIFPIQLKFKGGKGVATFLGILTSYNYFYSIILILIFIPLYCTNKKFTKSGIMSMVLLPIIAIFIKYPFGLGDIIKIFPLICIIIIKHKENILGTRK